MPPAMKFHVAREGAVLGEFEEQIFRNKVFSGEIRPNDLYWTAGFTDWRPVSEFRVARKTEPIVLDARFGRAPGNSKTGSAFGAGDCANLHMRTHIAHRRGDGRRENLNASACHNTRGLRRRRRSRAVSFEPE